MICLISLLLPFIQIERGRDKSVSYFCPTLVFEIPENLTLERRLFERGWDRSV